MTLATDTASRIASESFDESNLLKKPGPLRRPLRGGKFKPSDLADPSPRRGCRSDGESHAAKGADPEDGRGPSTKIPSGAPREDASNSLLQARDLEHQELEHRLRNIVNVMSVMIRMSARDESDPKALAEQIDRRLRALGDTHFQAFAKPEEAAMSLQKLITPILATYAPRGTSQFAIGDAETPVPASQVSALTLALHELAANAVKHGALSRAEGMIGIDVDPAPRGLALTWRESGGPTVVPPRRCSGSRIIRNLVEAAGGTLDFDWRPEGLVVRIEFAPVLSDPHPAI
ncbi:HWE histidine kinase domain-containing protein [Limimaricola litoreus]|uniref:histidine kinase n=1 Tax=Limimaricola litoreus TaxID=2955316 RepID=A0A9X2JPX4_9RHOB|nr:HWE histidine kinase domain-containing protein [Limimaricola litoreus]MCP1170502.1 hypothetical protein [Limimaricola litoreus]